MKIMIIALTMLSFSTLANETVNKKTEQAANQIVHTEQEVDKALEVTESTLEKIGRDIASEGEIEVVE